METTTYDSGIELQELMDGLDDRELLEVLTRNTDKLLWQASLRESQLKCQVRRLERQVQDLRTSWREPGIQSRFHAFAHLPPELRHRIWDFAIPKRFIIAITWDEYGYVTQRPPSVAHTCRESRAVATRCGGFFRTGDFLRPQWTWFQADRDVVVWTNDGHLGDVASVAESIVVFAKNLEDNAYITLTKLFRGQGFHNLKTIYVETGNNLNTADKMWSPAVVSELFGFDSILLPDLAARDDVMQRIQDVVSRDKADTVIRKAFIPYWQKSLKYVTEGDDKEGGWAEAWAWIVRCWCRVQADLSPYVGDEIDEDNWFDFMEDKYGVPLPEIIPTCMLAIVDDRTDSDIAGFPTVTATAE